jgi:hypothetical protein
MTNFLAVEVRKKHKIYCIRNNRLLAKVLFSIPQPYPSPKREGLKILSQEV